jgi:hypothetical protein
MNILITCVPELADAELFGTLGGVFVSCVKIVNGEFQN